MIQLCSVVRRAASRLAVLAFACGLPAAANAAPDVTLVGLIGQRAIVSIDGRITRTLSVGQRSPDGVRLIAVGEASATVEAGGLTRTLAVGQRLAPARGDEVVVLHPDSRGHYQAQGSINGAATRFVVDTGASMVSIGAGDARRIGIRVEDAPALSAMTANGVVQVRRVQLDSIRVGAIELRNVAAAIHEQDLPFVLLGMSFLSRMDMQREGETLTLKRRY